MNDADWRPSPCPACGLLREAAKDPVCETTGCPMAGQVNPEQFKAEPDTATRRKLVSYQSADGSLHQTLESAVQSDITALLDTVSEFGQCQNRSLAGYMMKQPFRSKLLKLLKELD